MAESADRLLTTPEVAELFGVSQKTVVRWAQQGTISSIRTPGGFYRFKESVIQAFLHSR